MATANPEDYTNRGRIITPLKDRFGAQIRTHYPLDADTEIAIVEQEAYPAHNAVALVAPGTAAGSPGDVAVDSGDAAARATSAAGLAVAVPTFMTRIVVAITRAARSSPHVSQRLGGVGATEHLQLRDDGGQRHAPHSAGRR